MYIIIIAVILNIARIDKIRTISTPTLAVLESVVRI